MTENEIKALFALLDKAMENNEIVVEDHMHVCHDISYVLFDDGVIKVHF